MTHLKPLDGGPAPSKSFYFVSGLPRAGSTLLCNLLAQNPRFHATHTSGCMDVMFGVRNNWGKLIEHQAHPEPTKLTQVLRGILEAYYSDVDKPVVFDKCRGWLSLLEMAEEVLGRQVKVLVPVRDLRDVLASFETLWRRRASSGQLPGEPEHYFQFQTAHGRCEFWMRPDQPVGLAYNRLHDAIQRGYGERLHFVRFEQLTQDPQRVMRGAYSFLGEPWFEHNFEYVEQVTREDDRIYGFGGLHAIRPRVEPVPPRWPNVLGPVAQHYAGMNFWDQPEPIDFRRHSHDKWQDEPIAALS